VVAQHHLFIFSSFFVFKVDYFRPLYTMSQMRPYTAARSHVAALAVQHLLELHLHAAEVVLDLGCGNGQKTFPLCKYFKRVIGVDASLHMLEDARAHRGDAPVEFLQGDFAKIPVDDASIDVVTMWNSLHFADPNTLVPELTRVLRPGGLVFICEPGPESRYGFSGDADAAVKIKNKVALVEAVRKVFIKSVEVIKYMPSAEGYTLVCRMLENAV
jgi:ubiquinone/menaquinone biosynthesis C-methylase UbiE